jgi:hypothetical protein
VRNINKSKNLIRKRKEIIMSYYVCQVRGIGIVCDDLFPKLNGKKFVATLLSNYECTDSETLEELRANNYLDESSKGTHLDYLDYDNLLNELDTHLCELLCEISEGYQLTYFFGGADDSREFLYFPPIYPWEVNDETPHKIEDVYKLIVDAVQQVTDLTESEIIDMITDLDEYEYI